MIVARKPRGCTVWFCEREHAIVGFHEAPDTECIALLALGYAVISNLHAKWFSGLQRTRRGDRQLLSFTMIIDWKVVEANRVDFKAQEIEIEAAQLDQRCRVNDGFAVQHVGLWIPLHVEVVVLHIVTAIAGLRQHAVVETSRPFDARRRMAAMTKLLCTSEFCVNRC